MKIKRLIRKEFSKKELLLFRLFILCVSVNSVVKMFFQ